MSQSKSQVKLSPKWCLDAAMLSRPVDLTTLVTMSKSCPEEFIHDNVLHRLTNLLNEQNNSKSDKECKLDVLNILANVSLANRTCLEEVTSSLSAISEWFDEYISNEESEASTEPELHKAMVLLLCRCWEYQLKTEDILELTQGNRRIALCTVVGLLEDGETYSTILKQRQKPGLGKVGQWEHELVINRYEKPLVLQICRLLRGFTHPGTYFDSRSRNEVSGEIELFNIEMFSEEMDMLLEITMRSRFVEKLSVALNDCLMLDHDDEVNEEKSSSRYTSKRGVLEESDHLAVACVHAFLQNLYFYGSRNVEEFRLHMLMDTLLIPNLAIPYLDRCVTHALILNSRAEMSSDMQGDEISQLILHSPHLVAGILSTLRTLIIASFRAPNTLYVMVLMKTLNPTNLLLRAGSFCRHHEYVFALLCMLNINMGALDLSDTSAPTSPTARNPSSPSKNSEDLNQSIHLFRNLERIYTSMPPAQQSRVLKRVMYSGALPLCRDTPSYITVMSMLVGGAAGQFEYSRSPKSQPPRGFSKLDSSSSNSPKNNTPRRHEESDSPNITGDDIDEDEEIKQIRAQAKRDYEARMTAASFINQSNDNKNQLEGNSQTSYQVAIAVTEIFDHQEDKNKSPSKKINASSTTHSDDKYRLLGELPSLLSKESQNRKIDKQINIHLKLPTDISKQHNKNEWMSDRKIEYKQSNEDDNDVKKSVPKEFLCSINGHVMKMPMKSPDGVYYEKETICLWLKTRGQVCPITAKPLTLNDLKPDDELRNRIKRYQIQQTALRVASEGDDDLYDF